MVVLLVHVDVVSRLRRRRRCCFRHEARRRPERGSRGEQRQVPLQLRRHDPPTPLRRSAALRRRQQPRPLRRPLPPLLRAAAEAEGHVRMGGGGGEPAVPAADGGPRHARLRREQGRPRQPDGGVRRGQQGPAPAAQDPGLPLPKADADALAIIHPVVQAQTGARPPPPALPHDDSFPCGGTAAPPPAAAPAARSTQRHSVAITYGVTSSRVRAGALLS